MKHRVGSLERDDLSQTNQQKEKTQINKIKDEMGAIVTDANGIQKIYKNVLLNWKSKINVWISRCIWPTKNKL